jgi:hypothetical protein
MNTSQSSKQPLNNKSTFPCSPFFSCGANHGAVIPDMDIRVYQVVTNTEKTIAFISEGPSCMSLPSVWQPPKFA